MSPSLPPPALPKTEASARADRRQIAAFFAFGVAFAWTFNGPRWCALINWDSGSLITATATKFLSWSTPPWNAHLGIDQEYLLGVWAARALGGTIIDGFRLTNALFFAGACAVLAHSTRVLTGSRALSALLTLAWMTAWVNFHYHFVLEDNFLFLAPAAAAMSLCATRIDHWRPRDGAVAGALCVLAFLGSWQAVPYLGAALFAALIGGGRTLVSRARDALLVLLSFLATLIAWTILYAATSKLTWIVLLHSVFSRPVPSAIPQNANAFLALFRDGNRILDTLGTGVAYQVSHNAYHLDVPFLARHVVLLGALALSLQLALLVGATLISWRSRHAAPHFLTVTLLLFTLATSLYKDPAGYAELKRYDFVPLLLTLLAASCIGLLRRRRALLPRLDSGLATLLVVIIALQSALALRWDRRQLSTYQTTTPYSHLPHTTDQFYGRDGMSFFSYFRAIREAHPNACLYLFSVAELADAKWNHDLSGALSSELPNYLAIATSSEWAALKPAKWRYPLQARPMEPAHFSAGRPSALIPDCALLSTDAQRVIDSR